jgi:hypothetical protein
LKSAWQVAQRRHPEDFASGTDDLLAWHLGQAAACERTLRWSLAAIHWQKILELKPNDRSISNRLALARSRLNRVAPTQDGESSRFSPPDLAANIPQRGTNTARNLIDLSVHYNR